MLKNIIDKIKPTNNFNLDVSDFHNALLKQLNIAGQTLALFENDGGHGIKFVVKQLTDANVQTLPFYKNIDSVRILTSAENPTSLGAVIDTHALGERNFN
ncbi:hypothetical protein AAU57_02060 [Nonlabens sp. YIK11]|uniref:hypothetical protein n=1 Tax=Nonlabens sp. YIK11 TaxID=1453349 RepID=UPI0006DC0E20|nr:hypothetical protein [Nonlabens sp. YIK11]KQC32242.1 hypothetical protein AAU57_02060 [Nonlabens sp. YIK11]